MRPLSGFRGVTCNDYEVGSYPNTLSVQSVGLFWIIRVQFIRKLLKLWPLRIDYPMGVRISAQELFPRSYYLVPYVGFRFRAVSESEQQYFGIQIRYSSADDFWFALK